MKTTQMMAVMVAILGSGVALDVMPQTPPSPQESRAPMSCGTIWAFPDARSSRCASISPREWHSAGARIRVQRSPTSSKGRWSMKSRASRR